MNDPRKSMKKSLLSLSLLVLTLVFATNTLADAGKIEQDAGPYHVIMQTSPENLTVNQAVTMTMVVQNKATGQTSNRCQSHDDAINHAPIAVLVAITATWAV